MTWDWKKTIEGGDNSPAVLPAKGPARPPKHPRARGARQTDASPEIRRDAGIVLRSTGTPHVEARPGDPPMLLYGKEYDCAFVARGSGPKTAFAPSAAGPERYAYLPRRCSVRSAAATAKSPGAPH